MSFASTPLGQGRRLDHRTFLNKKPVTTSSLGAAPQIQPAARTHRQQAHPPASYAYGAPTTSSRSPPKPERSAPTAPAPEEQNSDSEQPALVRFARLKQREQAQQQQTRVVGPRVISTPPNPDSWSFKDTSVNIASAFHRAAGTGTTIPIPAYDSSASSSSAQNTFNTSASIMNPNDSWAAGTQQRSTVPRSTSVEYEKETHSLVTRRLAPPPSRNNVVRPKPLSRTESVRYLAESSQEGDASRTSSNGRPKTFSEQVMDATRRLAPATFFMRRQSEEPEGPADKTVNTTQEKSSSYDYSAEERDFLDGDQDDSASGRAAATHRRNRISAENKAYKPTLSDLEESESDYSSDDGKKAKKPRAKKSGGIGGPLKTLPVAGYDKRRKRRRAGARDDGEEGEEGDGQESSEEEQTEGKSTEQLAVPRSPSAQRTSALPGMRLSVPRGSIPPTSRFNSGGLNGSMDMESGLQSIREVEEALEPDESVLEQVSQSTFSIGAVLGGGVFYVFKTLSLVLSSLWSTITYVPLLIWRFLGHTLQLLILAPAQRFANADKAPLLQLGKYVMVALTVYLAWFSLNSRILDYLPSRPNPSPYRPPVTQPSDIADLSARLLQLENIVAKVSLASERSQTYIDGTTRNQADLAGRIRELESRITKEASRVYEAGNKIKESTGQELQSVRREVELLHAQFELQKQGEKQRAPDAASDEQARVKLRALEERMGSVEGKVMDALELSKSAVAAGGSVSTVAAWWNKLATGKTAGVTIKSSDGQDVTSLITHLVDNAMMKASKDTLARQDFAMYSGGAFVIPSLTSETYEIRPQGLASQLLGSLTGNGYAVGRPPVTALHHEIHNGHCWPFPGQRGQLGIKLAAPVYITDVTIDHVARELATDLRAAPRQMELWGLVEGEDNKEKIQQWRALRSIEDESKIEYTDSLDPKHFVQLASFTYNIYDPSHIQTFPIPQEIQDLRVDFGVVVLAMKSNWGRDEFTCLYRVRVHGEQLGDFPEPLPESDLNSNIMSTSR